jgi:hypothetical protein
LLLDILLSLNRRFVDRNEDVFIEYSLIRDENICLQETVTRRGSTIEHIFGLIKLKKKDIYR